MRNKKTNDYAKTYKHNFTLRANKTALLVIDLQYATASRAKGLGEILQKQGKADTAKWRFDRIEESVIPNTRKLLNYFRKKELKIIYITLGSEKDDYSDIPPHALNLIKATNNVKGSKTHEILSEIKPLYNELVINKSTFDAFISTDLNNYLKELSIEFLVFCGVSTNTCIESTARNAADYGFNCVIAEDACGAPTEKLHRASLENYSRLFGRVALCREILLELEDERTTTT